MHSVAQAQSVWALPFSSARLLSGSGAWRTPSGRPPPIQWTSQPVSRLLLPPQFWKKRSRSWVHQAIAFAIASKFCRRLPFARDFRSEDDIFAISFAKPFAFASEFLRSAQFAAFCLRFGGQNSLANCRGASEFAFAFAAVSLRPQCTQSRSEKAILGATLGIPGYSRSNSRNGTHDLINVKTLFSEQLSDSLKWFWRQNFSPNSRSVFFKIGVVPARQNYTQKGYPFRFGNFSTDITEHSSQNILVRHTQACGNPLLTNCLRQ